VLCAAAALAGPKAPRLCPEQEAKCVAELSQRSERGSKKFNPGHYMAPYRGESQAALLDRAAEVCAEPALKGMEVRVLWSALERTAGQYTFGNVEQLYSKLAACKKRLILEVWPVTFDSDVDDFVPEYLEDLVAPTNQGYIAKLWEPEVMTRLIALYRALGRRFDDEPYFEGIVFTETATGGAESGYTVEKFIAQLTRGVKEIRAAWPRSTVIVFYNFLPGASDAQASAFAATLHVAGAGVGGPDVLPPPLAPTLGERVFRGELGGKDYRGKLVSAFAVQTPELGGRKGDFSPRELFDHCVKKNKCRYMFWARNTVTGGAHQQWSTGILPFIRKNPTL
jgi:hypothetical protein